MRKAVRFICILAVFLLVFSTALADDDSAPVAELYGCILTKGEVLDRSGEELELYAQFYSAIGQDFDPEDPETVSSFRQEVIDSFVREAVVTHKIEEYGLKLTEEEAKHARLAAEAEYSGYVRQMTGYYRDQGSDMSEDALAAEVREELAAYEMDLDSLIRSYRESAEEQKLYKLITADVDVTEDELQFELDYRISSEKAASDEDPSAFERKFRSGALYCYVPDGYRCVKHILLAFPDDYWNRMEELGERREALGDDASEEQLAEADAEIQRQTELAYESLQAVSDEVNAALTAGLAFDELVALYGSDTGMSESPVKEKGYPVCAETVSLPETFVQAAMALEHPGDISGPVRSVYGIHFIRYESDIPAGSVPLDSVRKELADEVLSMKKQDLYYDTVDVWVSEADVRIDWELLDR